MPTFIYPVAAALAIELAFTPVLTSPLGMIPQPFSSDLRIRDLFVSSPFEADAASSYNATMSVIVQDQEYPSEKSIHCQIEWRAGTGPPDSTEHQCENDTVRAWFPSGTFKGVEDFQLHFAHIVTDHNIGPCLRNCYLTKYAAVNLTYPSTPGYECDTDHATCEQRINTTLIAPVFLAVS